MNRLKIIAIFLMPLLYFSISFSGTTGKIKGVVLDKETGEPLVGANVVIKGTAMGAATNLDGSYFIINVPPGKYSLEIIAIGYQSVVVNDVRVVTDRTTIQNFMLSQQILEGEAVVVVASRPIVEKDRTNTMAYVTSEQIDALPVQEVEDLISLQSGITKDASGKFHMRGGRAGEIAYMVDGIPVTDQYRGGSLVEMENSWIQELQVISGTFNAEYGQAQSGVINVVSKGGTQEFSGDATLWLGDHVSGNDDIYMNIGKVGLGEYNLQLSLSGPISFFPDASFFFSGRIYNTDGWLYGERRTRIDDTVPIQAYYHEAQQNPSEEERLIGIRIPDSLQTGDGSYVPLNPRMKYSIYGNIRFRLWQGADITYSLFADQQTWKTYSDARRYAPDGVPEKYRTSFNHILNFTHSLSNRTFYKLGFSYSSKEDKSYLFEDPLDNRYQGKALYLNGFYFGGTNNSRYDNIINTMLGKFDLTSQVNSYNLVKFGGVLKYHDITHNTLTTISRSAVYEPPNLEIPARNTSNNNFYNHKPLEFAVYIQDKVEFNEIIFNAGLRFDYWDSRSEVLTDLEAITDIDDGIRSSSPREPSTPSWQVSPRFGLAFPVSSTGVFHVSYGHFFQIPRFSYIFANSEFEIELGDLETIMGNANLLPEKNISYEIGFQQELAATWGLNITVYYKDIKNLLGQEIINTRDKKVYARYINRDYGNVKGITLALEKIYSDMFAATIDYTYQVARGNASDPNSVFYDFQSHPPRESEKQVLPLDWDQPHIINATVRIGDPRSWNIGIIGRYESGQPYTPSNPGSALTTQFRNSDRKPDIFYINLNLYKTFKLFNQKMRLFAKIYNLFDNLNEIKVYSSTGRAQFPYRTNADRQILERNPNFSLEEIDLRPDFYHEPRRVVLGLTVYF